MSIAVSPHTRFAAALIAAGVVSAASVVGLPEHRAVAIDVANASAVTDALYSLGKGVEVVSSLVGIHADAVVSLPFEASLAVLAATQHPELGSSVLSYLVQRFVNPAIGPPITAYPWETEQTAALVASLLPYPFGPNATDPGLVNEARFEFAAAFDNVLKHLGDPLPGFGAVQDVMNDTVLGGVVEAGQLAVRAPLYMGWNTVNYLGNLPVNVEASIESAIATPSQIPGLVSNLVYGLLSPNADVGLLGQLLNNVVDPFTWLPAPIGSSSSAVTGLANQIRVAITHAMNHVLSLLPAPVTPSALPAATAATGQPTYSVGAGKGATAPAALPAATVALADGVVIAPATKTKKVSETRVSKVEPTTAPTAAKDTTAASSDVAEASPTTATASDTSDKPETSDTSTPKAKHVKPKHAKRAPRQRADRGVDGDGPHSVSAKAPAKASA